MAKKIKTARAIEANAGIQQKFKKKLLTFSRAFSTEIVKAILLDLADNGLLAQDRSLTNPKNPQDKRTLQEISKMVLAKWSRNPEFFKDHVEQFIAQHLGSWIAKATPQARKIAEWVARSTAADVTASQRQAYVAAGLPFDFMAEKWTVPVVRQRISQKAADELPSIIEWSTNLITKMAVNDVQRLQDVIVSTLADGKNITSMRKLLGVTSGFDADRARRVAIDQTNKIANGILRANDFSLGITEGIWVHVPGRFSSRETHKAMNGKRFDLAKGMFDPAVNRFVSCAELPFCRCVYRPALNFSQLLKTK